MFQRFIMGGVTLGLILSLGCTSSSDDESPLKKVRLFSVDVVADVIQELNPRSGKVIQFFAAPGVGGISGNGCGLAYDSDANRVFFHDSVTQPNDIWSINPDDPDPTGTAVTLPNFVPSAGSYTALAHDGTFLLGLIASTDTIEWLNPVTGDWIKSHTYPEDLDEGIDATPTRLFSMGQGVVEPWAIRELDFSGNVLASADVTIGGFTPRALAAARGYWFIADMGNSEIIVVKIESLDRVDTFPIQGATSVSGLAAGSE
jgi:hypothetical protein